MVGSGRGFRPRPPESMNAHSAFATPHSKIET